MAKPRPARRPGDWPSLRPVFRGRSCHQHQPERSPGRRARRRSAGLSHCRARNRAAALRYDGARIEHARQTRKPQSGSCRVRTIMARGSERLKQVYDELLKGGGDEWAKIVDELLIGLRGEASQRRGDVRGTSSLVTKTPTSACASWRLKICKRRPIETACNMTPINPKVRAVQAWQDLLKRRGVTPQTGQARDRDQGESRRGSQRSCFGSSIFFSPSTVRALAAAVSNSEISIW